jgi:hypothetical protein
MKELSPRKSDQDIPEVKREQLGIGVCGKYFNRLAQASKVVIKAGVNTRQAAFSNTEYTK